MKLSELITELEALQGAHGPDTIVTRRGFTSAYRVQCAEATELYVHPDAEACEEYSPDDRHKLTTVIRIV